MKNEISALKRWLKENGNSEAKLASILGYSSSVSISNWISRKRIPRHRLIQVLEIIGYGEVPVTSEKRQIKKAARRSNNRG